MIANGIAFVIAKNQTAGRPKLDTTKSPAKEARLRIDSRKRLVQKHSWFTIQVALLTGLRPPGRCTKSLQLVCQTTRYVHVAIGRMSLSV